MTFHTHCFNDRIRALSVCQIEDLLLKLFTCIIQHLSPCLPGQGEPFGNGVNRYYFLRTQEEGRLDCKKANGATAENRNALSGPNVAIFRRHISGWKNV
ncbi:hypothetical protein D3C80_1995730 [compost metagenome]